MLDEAIHTARTDFAARIESEVSEGVSEARDE